MNISNLIHWTKSVHIEKTGVISPMLTLPCEVRLRRGFFSVPIFKIITKYNFACFFWEAIMETATCVYVPAILPEDCPFYNVTRYHFPGCAVFFEQQRRFSVVNVCFFHY